MLKYFKGKLAIAVACLVVANSIGGALNYLTSGYFSQALWEKAYEVSTADMIVDPQANTPPSTQDKNLEFKGSSIVFSVELLLTLGWSTSLGLVCFIVIVHFQSKKQNHDSEHRQPDSATSQLEGVASLFNLLGNEVFKAKPVKTKTDWSHERGSLTAMVNTYKAIALDRIEQVMKDWPNLASRITKVHDKVVEHLDKMTSKLGEDHNAEEKQRAQLKETAEFAWELSKKIRESSYENDTN